MPRQKTQGEMLTVGQLAKRWNVSVDRVWQLIRLGHLPETFTIPSAGRFGRTTKIPMSAVLAAEDAWAVTPVTNHGPRRRARPSKTGAALRHFPELSPTSEHDAECHAADPHSDARSGAAYG